MESTIAGFMDRIRTCNNAADERHTFVPLWVGTSNVGHLKQRCGGNHVGSHEEHKHSCIFPKLMVIDSSLGATLSAPSTRMPSPNVDSTPRLAGAPSSLEASWQSMRLTDCVRHSFVQQLREADTAGVFRFGEGEYGGVELSDQLVDAAQRTAAVAG